MPSISAFSFPPTETIACCSDPGRSESTDELDSTAMVRQRSAGVSAIDIQSRVGIGKDSSVSLVELLIFRSKESREAPNKQSY